MAKRTTVSKEPPKAIGYIRVSTEQQAQSGLGQLDQRAAVIAAARRRRLPLADAHIFEDAGLCGALDASKRDGLRDALCALGPGDSLIVARRDRLARDSFLVHMIERDLSRKKIRIVSAAGEGTDNDSPDSVLLRRISDAMSEYFRTVTRIRTKGALAAKRAKGEACSDRAPYGWRVAKKTRDGVRILEKDDDEQKVLAQVRRWIVSGMGSAAIHRRLKQEGIECRQGGDWNFLVVNKIVKRINAEMDAKSAA